MHYYHYKCLWLLHAWNDINLLQIVTQVCLPVPGKVLLPPPHHDEVDPALRGKNVCVWTSTYAQSLHPHLNRAHTVNVIETYMYMSHALGQLITTHMWEPFYLVESTTVLPDQSTLIWPSLWGKFSLGRFTEGSFWLMVWGLKVISGLPYWGDIIVINWGE